MSTDLSRDSALRNKARDRIEKGVRGEKAKNSIRYPRPQLQCAQIAITNHEAAGLLHGALKVYR